MSTPIEIQTNKKLISMRYWLLGKGFLLALKALEYARNFHTGTRKDGITPEFDHQLTIASYVRTIADSLIDPEAVLAVVFLHDVCEDYDVGFAEIESLFSRKIADAVKLTTKKYRGDVLDKDVYFINMSKCPIASIVKGSDRMHNMQTMSEVFGQDKQLKYCDETQNQILPMLKTARRMFPEQEPAYENIKLVLSSQVQLIKISLKDSTNE